MADRITVDPKKNGPLVVVGVRRMIGPDGEAIETKERMFLCRCGHSSNKPFCDSSHKDAGFDSSAGTPAGKDRIHVYAGRTVDVLYNPRLCSHAAECVRLLPKAFDPERRPWIDPDQAEAESLAGAVRACPSGALRIAEKEGEPRHLSPDRPDIVVQKDGPYWLTGAAFPADPPGEAACEDKFVLCRCGLSGNKPYCDGSHRDRGWSDEQG